MTKTDWQFSLDNPEKNLTIRVATEEEINALVAGSPVSNQSIDKTQRANPVMSYYDNTIANSPPIVTNDDKILLEIFNTAIKNGWKGWRNIVNDSITVGQEGENVIKALKTYKKDLPLRDLLANDDLCMALFGRSDAQLHKEKMANEPNMLGYIQKNMIRR